MKKLLYLIAIVLCFKHNAFSQAGQWKLAGNNLTGTEELGSNNAQDVRLVTSNVTRMTIKADGKIGIGTSIPLYPLHVDGLLTGYNFYVNGSSVFNGDVDIITDQGNIGFQAPGSELAAGTAMIFMSNDSTAGFSRMVFAEHLNSGLYRGLKYDFNDEQFDFQNGIGNSILSIDLTNGYVGIGTDIPAEFFHVDGHSLFSGNIKFDSDFSTITFSEADATNSPMIQMFASGAANGDRMVIAHSSAFSDWGLQYEDINDEFHFLASGSKKLSFELSPGQLGIGTENPSFQLHLSTNSAGKPTSSTWTVISDARLKKNIAAFTDGLNVIEKINPITYNYTGEAGMPTNDLAIGTTAQEMKEIAPYMVGEWIYENENGEEKTYLDVDYHALFFISVNAIKEQQTMIVELQNQVEQTEVVNQDLQNQIDALRNLILENTNKNQEFAQTNISKLGQNIPNPSNHSTQIHFELTSDHEVAKIQINDAEGREVTNFDISKNSKGSIILNTQNFQAGKYIYSLILDGKMIDTKWMIIAH